MKETLSELVRHAEYPLHFKLVNLEADLIDCIHGAKWGQ